MRKTTKPTTAAARYDPGPEQLRADVDALRQTVAGLVNSVADLAVEVKVLDRVIVAVSQPLLRQLLGLRDLLIEKGVLTADEVLAAAQCAELRAMLERSSEERRNDVDG